MTESAPSRLRSLRRVSTVLVGCGATALAWMPSEAHAQIDVNPPLPNVMLMLDTSGSLERLPNGNLPTVAECTTAGYTPNRWHSLVAALTGQIQSPSCMVLDRSDSTFRSEYGTNHYGNDPYDLNYYLPFHRVASNDCTLAPNNKGADWWDFPTDAVREVNAAWGSCAGPGFRQRPDGIIDIFGDRVRFGLMTFDPLTDPASGYVNSGDSDAGQIGAWSYWYSSAGNNWASGSGQAIGWPIGCISDLDVEVGARNPAAPPWEGRLIGFGDYDLDYASTQANNDDVETAILSMRPYGATPIAGMLSDGLDFFAREDGTIPPGGAPHTPDANQALGPKDDPYWDTPPGEQCRKSFIVLVSDGEPNMDLRPDCETTTQCTGDHNVNGCCPFARPEVTAGILASNPYDVDVYVVALGQDAPVTIGGSGGDPFFGNVIDCAADIDGSDFVAGQICNQNSPLPQYAENLEACCALNHIAIEGQTGGAYFASNTTALETVLSNVLDNIAAGATGRTAPVFNVSRDVRYQGNLDAPSADSARGYQFLSSLEAPLGTELWRGHLERRRYVCSSGNPILDDFQPADGDDYAVNLNNARGLRKYWTSQPEVISGARFPSRSVRPGLVADPDGLGLHDSVDTPLVNLSTFATSTVDTTTVGTDPSYPSGCDQLIDPSASDAYGCKLKLLQWNGGDPILDANGDTKQRRSALGAIYHSTPTVVGPPGAFLRDEAYAQYAEDEATRPTMMYTATTDGQLHAFIVKPNAAPSAAFPAIDQNNDQPELWTFFPPGVLQGLPNTYNRQAVLLDGPPVVQDVVFKRDIGQADAGNSGTGATWNRVLVAGSGASIANAGFYYAIDVSIPDQPKFLWQLSTDNADDPLFGPEVPPPAIATVAINDPAGGTARVEVAVAILAGGSGDAVKPAAPCARQVVPANAQSPRGSVRCWEPPIPSKRQPGRSVTVVLLETGEVLANLRATADEGPASMSACGSPDSGCYSLAPFDSPLTGRPVPFPAGPGQIATRAYIGDADGTLWRVNMRDLDPAAWTAEIAFDAYWEDGALEGQPIDVPPVVSVDGLGNPVVLFSTGEQETFGYTNLMKNYIVSFTEDVFGATGFNPDQNWKQQFLDGERVTGPLELFEGITYFATFRPDTTASCEFGNARVWGLDYKESVGGLNLLPVARFDDDGDQSAVTPDVPFIEEAPLTVIFGVNVTQVPSCYDITTGGGDSAYFANAGTSVDNLNAGGFQLVYSTGKGGTSDPGVATRTFTRPLNTPAPRLSVDSYAAIIE